MVKNVRGIEVPFNTNEEKQDWYIDHERAELEINLVEGSYRIPGKDILFFEKVIPFIEEKEIKTILDVGAGKGRYAAWLRAAGAAITALELNALNVGILESELRHSNIEDIVVKLQDFETATAEEIGVHDLIYMTDVVEHFMDWSAAMQKAAELCKYCYVLIPGDMSFNSPGHLTIFDHKTILNLVSLFKGIEFYQKAIYDEDNWWHTIMLEGFA